MATTSPATAKAVAKEGCRKFPLYMHVLMSHVCVANLNMPMVRRHWLKEQNS